MTPAYRSTRLSLPPIWIPSINSRAYTDKSIHLSTINNINYLHKGAFSRRGNFPRPGYIYIYIYIYIYMCYIYNTLCMLYIQYVLYSKSPYIVNHLRNSSIASTELVLTIPSISNARSQIQNCFKTWFRTPFWKDLIYWLLVFVWVFQ